MKVVKHNWKKIIAKYDEQIKKKEKELWVKMQESGKEKKFGKVPNEHQISRMVSLNFEINKLQSQRTESIINWIIDLKSQDSC